MVEDPGSANVVHNHYSRAFVLKAFDSPSGAVLFLGFAHQKSFNVAAGDADRHHNRIGAHGEPANGLGLPSASPNFFQKNLPGQPRALGRKRSGAAVNVVVAGPSGRKLELPQPERL